MGQHLLGPDNRIYIAKGAGFTGPNTNTYYTHHMDVILEPNLLGVACNYKSSFFDLGSGRTIQGLPTMLNYNLGPVIGSICDSLTNGINENIDEEKLFNIYPNPFVDEINVHSLYDIKGKFIIQNELGAIVFIEDINGNKTFDVSILNAGCYFMKIETEEKVFVKKLVKIK